MCWPQKLVLCIYFIHFIGPCWTSGLYDGAKQDNIKMIHALLAMVPGNCTTFILEMNRFKELNIWDLSMSLQENNRALFMFTNQEEWKKNIMEIKRNKCQMHIILGKENNLIPLLQYIWENKLTRSGFYYFILTPKYSFSLIEQRAEAQDIMNLIMAKVQAFNSNIVPFYILDPNGGTRGGFTSKIHKTWVKNQSRFYPKQHVLYPQKFSDMNGRPIKCTYIKVFPYFYNENPEEFLGVDKNVVESIGVKMNYDLKYKVSVDGNFGAMSEEGNFSFNGMVGMVQRREVDCALSAITKSYIRSKVIDFSIGTYNTHASFITRKTGPVAKWRAMLNPFGINVWIALILTLIGFLSSYHFILKLSYHETTLSFQTSFLNIWGSFFNQTIIHPKKTSSRILMGSWFLFSICIVASYGGSLRSFLTLPLAKTPIDYLDGLVKSPLMIIILKGSIFENVFRDSKDNIFQRLWNKALTHNAEDVKCSNITTCIKLVKEKPGMSFIFDEDILESTVLTLPESQSNIRMARGAFFPSEYAIVFRKNAPYLDRFNEYLLKVKEAGLVEHWRRSALFRRKFENMGKELLDKNKKEMKEEEESVNEPITLDHLQGALMLYACGIGISLLIYISEKMLNPPHRHRKEKRRWIS